MTATAGGLPLAVQCHLDTMQPKGMEQAGRGMLWYVRSKRALRASRASKLHCIPHSRILPAIE